MEQPTAGRGSRILFLIVLAALSVSNAAYSQSECTPVWEPKFQDDFGQNTLDVTQWNPYYSPGHAGNGLRRPAAISVNDGMLTITAKMIDGAIVSGGMSHRTPYTYGRFEARVRTDNPDPNQATSAVLIAWPVVQDYNNGNYTELDFYETGHNKPSREPFYAFVHYNVPNHPDRPRFAYHADASDWHHVRMDWTESSLAFYLDGELINTVTRPETIPHTPHRMTVQLDAFKQFMQGAVEMQVDWVRISSYNPSGDPECNEPPVNEVKLRIEAEDYDEGGQNVGYFDWSEGNFGGAYRSDDMDIEISYDTDRNYAIGFLSDDEWLRYTVDVPVGGQYDIRLRYVVNKSDGAQRAVLSLGDTTLGEVSLPNTGGWDEWSEVVIPGVVLPAGEQRLRLTFYGGWTKFNWLELIQHP